MALNVSQLVKGLELLKDEAVDFHADGIPEDVGFWWHLTHLEPAMYRGAVVAVAALAGAAGLVVSDQSTGAVIALATAVVGLVQAFWTRGAVTANQRVVVYKPDPVNDPSHVAAGLAVATDAVAVVNTAADTPATPRPITGLPLYLPPPPSIGGK
jgi:hypothetical protein